MNLSPRWVGFLTAAGHDAVHWIDIGEPNAPDRVILDHAIRRGLVILTQDLDFGTLLAVGGLRTPSVVQFRAQAVLPSDVGQRASRGHRSCALSPGGRGAGDGGSRWASRHCPADPPRVRRTHLAR